MSTGQVWTCIEWDELTSSCTVEGWADPPSSWPTMTLDDALMIGYAIGLIWAIGWGFGQIKRLINDS